MSCQNCKTSCRLLTQRSYSVSQYTFPDGIGPKVAADDLVFLLSSPLFLYAITPRLRHACQDFGSVQSKSTHDSSAAPAIEARNLAITTGVSNSSYFTQLEHGKATLISIREPIHSSEGARKQSVVWFCEEVEFLACEYRAREEAAAEILGCGLANSVRSRIVKLKVGRKYLLAKMKMNHNATKKERKVKLRLRLRKDAVEA